VTSKKRQHFVPRFYLRRFSNLPDRQSIDLWNMQSTLLVRHASTRDQAYADHFYSKDLIFEDALGQIDDGASQILHVIEATEQVPDYDSVIREPLLAYVLFQSERTKYAVQAFRESSSKFNRIVFKTEEGLQGALATASEQQENPSVFLLQLASRILPVVTDLEMKLLRNRTECHFITSDNPVVKYNQFLESRGWPGSHTGWATAGLQVFFPIGPTLCIVLYDRDVYRVGHRREYVVDVERTPDVDQLNALQFLNADENIYFTSSVSDDYILRLDHQYRRKRRTEKVSVEEFHGPDSAWPTRRTLVACSTCDVNMNLSLSFIAQTKKAKSRRVGPSMANPRNPRVLAQVEEAFGKNGL